MPRKTTTPGDARPKSAPLDLDTASRVDETIRRVVDELAELSADLAFGEDPERPDHDIRDLRRTIDAARSHLAPAQGTAHRLWVAAHAAATAGEARR